MNKQELIAGIRERKIIAILRGLPERQAVQTAQALYAGGIRFIEITFAQDREECLRDTAGAIRAVSGLYPDLHVGAGTVLTLSQLEAAEAAGAAYIISPNTDEEIIRQTVRRGLVSIPGAMTPSEIVQAASYGADFVKVFPAAALGAAYIRAIRAPLPQIPLLAVGGADAENVSAFLRAGCVGVGIGGSLTNRAWIEAGDYASITRAAQAVCRAAEG